MMMLVVTGDESRRIEKQSLNATKEEIVMLLKGIYGSNFTEPTGENKIYEVLSFLQ